MKQFMDKDFLLTNEVAKELFFDVANTMPIVDYHCHIAVSYTHLDVYKRQVHTA